MTSSACRSPRSPRTWGAPPRPAGSSPKHPRQAAPAFRDACETGDLDALVCLLDPAVESRSDGGGKVRAALRPVVGRDKVVRLVLGLMRREPEVELVQEDVNGTPGLTVRIAGTTVAVLTMGVHDGLITD